MNGATKHVPWINTVVETEDRVSCNRKWFLGQLHAAWMLLGNPADDTVAKNPIERTTK